MLTDCLLPVIYTHSARRACVFIRFREGLLALTEPFKPKAVLVNRQVLNLALPVVGVAVKRVNERHVIEFSSSGPELAVAERNPMRARDVVAHALVRTVRIHKRLSSCK